MRVEVNEAGEVWYYPDDPTKPPQLLEDADSLCGMGILNTGPNDPFRDCCSWHDNAYSHRAFFEERGWDRFKIDSYFHELMLNRADGDLILSLIADRYFKTVRMIGWYPYYKHPGYVMNALQPAISNNEYVLLFLERLRTQPEP